VQASSTCWASSAKSPESGHPYLSMYFIINFLIVRLALSISWFFGFLIRLPEEIFDTMGITEIYEFLGVKLIISLHSNRCTHLHNNLNEGVDNIFYPVTPAYILSF
jgi:hypothetical protein